MKANEILSPVSVSKDVGQANGQQEDDLFDVKENDDARTNGETRV